MTPTQKSTGRTHVIAAVKAPIAFFTLALLVIEAILGGLGISRSLGEEGGLVLAYGMVSSLLIVLLGFLFTLFFRPHVLFTSGSDYEAIAAFRRLGDGLTPPDVMVLKRMLGSGNNYFSTFCEGLPQDVNTTPPAKRQSKLEKMGLIQKEHSEVGLTMLGTNFIQAIARFTAP
jgi:hypothetical protein